MNIFIDAISNPATIILFDNKKQIIDTIVWSAVTNESKTLIPNIHTILKKNLLEYKDLENISLVNWPGSFTWVRIAVLVANSINYIIKKNMTSLSFFDLYELAFEKPYPIVKSSSKRDLFVKKTNNNKIDIIKNEDFLKYLKETDIINIYWEIWNNLIWDFELNKILDYTEIIKNLKLTNLEILEPLYIKKPNIS